MMSPMCIGGLNLGGGTASALTKNTRYPFFIPPTGVPLTPSLPPLAMRGEDDDVASPPPSLWRFRLPEEKIRSRVLASRDQSCCICNSTSRGGMNLCALVPALAPDMLPAAARGTPATLPSPSMSSPSSESSSDIGSESSPSPSFSSFWLPGSRLWDILRNGSKGGWRWGARGSSEVYVRNRQLGL